MKTDFAELKNSIESVANPRDREISKAMAVLISALEVGPNEASLVRKTGYSSHFVASIVTRMRRAGLWSTELVDDREWWNCDGDLDGATLFLHALVALGEITWTPMPSGAKYFEVTTGQLVREWTSPEQPQ